MLHNGSPDRAQTPQCAPGMNLPNRVDPSNRVDLPNRVDPPNRVDLPNRVDPPNRTRCRSR